MTVRGNQACRVQVATPGQQAVRLFERGRLGDNVRRIYRLEDTGRVVSNP